MKRDILSAVVAIKTWTKAQAPELYKVIGKPAKDSAIRRLRKEVPQAPKEFVTFLEIMNGQADADRDVPLGLIPGGRYPFYFYNIKRIVETFGSASGYALDKRKTKCSPEIQPVWFDASWIEFASDDDSALIIDLHPTKKGKVGQIIFWSYETPIRRLVWDSFTEFLNDLANCYQKDQVSWKDGLLKRKKGCRFPDLSN